MNDEIQNTTKQNILNFFIQNNLYNNLGVDNYLPNNNINLNSNNKNFKIFNHNRKIEHINLSDAAHENNTSNIKLNTPNNFKIKHFATKSVVNIMNKDINQIKYQNKEIEFINLDEDLENDSKSGTNSYLNSIKNNTNYTRAYLYENEIKFKTILIYFQDTTCEIQWLNFIDDEILPKWKSVIFDKRIQDFVNLTNSIKNECKCYGYCNNSKECECSLLNLFVNKDFSFCYDINLKNSSNKFSNNFTINKTLIKTFESHHHIFECSNKCNCNQENCQLSLTKFRDSFISHEELIKYFVQRIRKTRLVGDKIVARVMWGLFTKENIPKNTYIMDYCGEIITNKEAEKRGKIYDSEAMSYLFDISSDVDKDFMRSYKKFCKKRDVDYRFIDRNMNLNSENDFPLVIDAKEYGNLGRFINHSCNPNLITINVHQECNDPRYANIALFAVKDIKAGTELSIDYNYESFEGADEVYCLCLEKDCRNFLYSST